MEFSIDYRAGGGAPDVEVVLSGVATPKAYAGFTESLVSDPRFRAGLTVLVDCSSLDTSGLSDAAVEGITRPVLERDGRYPPAAVAIVAPDERTYNDVRSFRAQLGGSSSNRHLFTSRDDAVAWLAEQTRE